MSSQLLKKIYYDIENPASFSSYDRLYHEARKYDPKIKLSDVKSFLAGELTYTLHRRVVRKFTRNPVIANRHGEMCQADLIDIQKYRRENSNIGYILTCIDCFSRFAYAIPIKTKSARDVTAAFVSLFQRYRPVKLQTDEGKEFTNTMLQDTYS